MPGSAGSARPTATRRTCSACCAAAEQHLSGWMPSHLNGFAAPSPRRSAGVRRADRHGLTGSITASGTLDRVLRAVRGRLPGRAGQGHSGGRCSDLLGGPVRDSVPFSAYLFYKWAGHPGAETRRCVRRGTRPGRHRRAGAVMLSTTTGSPPLKLKGGVFPPAEEIAAIRALREPRSRIMPLRLDPNAGWTSGDVASRSRRQTDGLLEYLEDPTAGIDGMAEVASRGPDAAGHQHVRGRASSTSPRPSARARCRWSSPTTTTGAGCTVAPPGRDLPHLRRRGCPCTPTATWASAWPP